MPLNSRGPGRSLMTSFVAKYPIFWSYSDFAMKSRVSSALVPLYNALLFVPWGIFSVHVLLATEDARLGRLQVLVPRACLNGDTRPNMRFCTLVPCLRAFCAVGTRSESTGPVQTQTRELFFPYPLHQRHPTVYGKHGQLGYSRPKFQGPQIYTAFSQYQHTFPKK